MHSHYLNLCRMVQYVSCVSGAVSLLLFFVSLFLGRNFPGRNVQWGEIAGDELRWVDVWCGANCTPGRIGEGRVGMIRFGKNVL